jgi:choline dehydrogenase
MENFDYVIVGGGSAGCVIANRLVQDGKRVCVLEAGPVDRNLFIHMPAGFVKTLFNPAVTWQFTAEPSAWTGGRRVPTTQGRTLGGSSSVNGMVFVRGQSDDYDIWAQRGNRGWSYASVLPYFRRIEQRISTTADERYRGRDGNLPVTDIDWSHPLCEAFIKGAQSLGYPRNPDYNGATQEGVGYYQRVIHRTRRVSAARAYLHPLMNRPNLKVITAAQAACVVLDGRRAVGVRYRRDGDPTLQQVNAQQEVIVCAGAANSPKLLQLSGIGDPDRLGEHGIAVLHALPAVGENLADHYSPRIVVRAKNIETINAMVSGPRLAGQLLRWAARKPSVLSLSAALVYAFGRSDPSLHAPDYTVIFTPASYKEGKLGSLDDYPGMTCGAWQMRPESRGHVHICSNNPAIDPIIQPNYLAAEKDRQVLLRAIRAARAILATPALAPYYDTEMVPGAGRLSDADLLEFARQYGSSTYHLCGTCRMGPAEDRSSVVDDQLRVHGLQGLRVADSSIMPSMVSANTYATTLMIAEKAADLVLGRPAPAQAELGGKQCRQHVEP